MKHTLAIGFPGMIRPKQYSVMIFNPGVVLVVSMMTLMGSVKTKAMAQAKRRPHHGSCTSSVNTAQRTMANAMDTASRM